MLHPRTYAAKTPDKPAYIMSNTGRIVTYRQLEERANRCARLFVRNGLQAGDAIAIVMENHEKYLEIVCAAQVAGINFVTISSQFTSPEIEYIINDSGAKVMVASGHMKDRVKDLAARTPGVRLRLMVDGVIDGYVAYEETVVQFSSEPLTERCEGKPMQYTSGTTGRPKGVLRVHEKELPFGTLEQLSLNIINVTGLNDHSTYLSPAPLYHAAPLNFCLWTLRVGGTVVVMDRFEADVALRLIEKFKVTHSQWVPTMFIRMLKLPAEEREKYDLTSMQCVLHAGAPCPVPVKEKMIEWWGPIFMEYYGSTEAHTATFISTREWLDHKGSVGRCLKGKIHILDELENDLPAGVEGEIFVEGGSDFEYYNNPQKTALSRNAKGWTTVGDIGYLDEDGYLYITDRKENIIISGGVNIYPQEIENVLILHPKVTDVAVFGTADDEYGESVVAVIVPSDKDAPPDPLKQELIAFCRQYLAGYKCPKIVHFVSSLPRTHTGKLLKSKIKEKYSR